MTWFYDRFAVVVFTPEHKHKRSFLSPLFIQIHVRFISKRIDGAINVQFSFFLEKSIRVSLIRYIIRFARIRPECHGNFVKHKRTHSHTHSIRMSVLNKFAVHLVDQPEPVFASKCEFIEKTSHFILRAHMRLHARADSVRSAAFPAVHVHVR